MIIFLIVEWLEDTVVDGRVEAVVRVIALQGVRPWLAAEHTDEEHRYLPCD